MFDGTYENLSAAMDLLARAPGLRGAGAYTWVTYSGKPRTLSKRGREVTLKRGMRFGYRAATSSKGAVRVILEELGPTHVFSMTQDELAPLLGKRGSAKAAPGRAPAGRAPKAPKAAKPSKPVDLSSLAKLMEKLPAGRRKALIATIRRIVKEFLRNM